MNLREFVRIFFYVRYLFQILGVFGNAFMFALYFKPQLRKLSVAFFFQALALTHFCINIEWLLLDIFKNFDKQNSETSCKFLSYLSYILAPISAWVEVAAGFDRLFNILFSTRFHVLKTVRFRIILIILIVVYNMAFYFKIFLDYKLFYYHYSSTNALISSYSVCGTNSKIEIKYAHFFNSTAVPFLLATISSLLTFVGVLRVRKRVSASSSSPSASRTTTLVRDMRFGVTIIFMNMSFFVLNCPFRLGDITEINPFRLETQIFWYVVFSNVICIMYELYFASCFYVQLAVNSLVRRELIKTLSRKSTSF